MAKKEQSKQVKPVVPLSCTLGLHYQKKINSIHYQCMYCSYLSYNIYDNTQPVTLVILTKLLNKTKTKKNAIY